MGEAPQSVALLEEQPQQILTGFVYTKDLIEQQLKVERWAKKEAKRARRANIGWKSATGISVVLLAATVFALDATIPNIRLLPVFLWTQPDGAIGSAITTEGMDATLSDATIQSALWQYVHKFESYSWTEKEENYYIVCAMSSNGVKAAYTEWVNGKDGFPTVYKDRAIIRTAETFIDAFQRPVGGQPGHFTVRFSRQISFINDATIYPVETWSARLDFVMGYQYGMKISDILQFNPLRIVVTSYPGSWSLSATPSAKPGGVR